MLTLVHLSVGLLLSICFLLQFTLAWMYAQMGVEIIGQQTSLDDVVSLFLDLSPCVCVCVRARKVCHVGEWGGDPAALNVPPLAYCISLSSEGVRAGPPTSHHSQTSKKSLLVTRLRKAGLHVHVHVQLMCLFLTFKKKCLIIPSSRSHK